MSCRHDLAIGTCIRCYPDNPDKRSAQDRVDPGPEEGYAPNIDGPGAVPAEVTADNLTDEQIRSLRHEASDHAVTIVCKRAITASKTRKELEMACRSVAEAQPTGMSMEHLNHKLLEIGLAMGRALIARDQCADAINARAKAGTR